MLKGDNFNPLTALDSFNSCKVSPGPFIGGTANARGDHDGTSDPTTLFTVTGDVPYDTRDFIRLEFDSDGSHNFGIIDVVINPSYITFTANTIELSVDGGGHIGYIDYLLNSKGSPFIIHNTGHSQGEIFNIPLLFEGGLLFGNSA